MQNAFLSEALIYPRANCCFDFFNRFGDGCSEHPASGFRDKDIIFYPYTAESNVRILPRCN